MCMERNRWNSNYDTLSIDCAMQELSLLHVDFIPCVFLPLLYHMFAHRLCVVYAHVCAEALATPSSSLIETFCFLWMLWWWYRFCFSCFCHKTRLITPLPCHSVNIPCPNPLPASIVWIFHVQILASLSRVDVVEIFMSKSSPTSVMWMLLNVPRPNPSVADPQTCKLINVCHFPPHTTS